LRMDDRAVFDEAHALILRLVRDGIVDGLRIDHVDGLWDPEAYLARLRENVGASFLIVVEKILAYDEQLRESWPVEGTTGYEFLNDVEDVLLAPSGVAEIERSYRRMRRRADADFRQVARAAKLAMLEGPLRAEVERIALTA